MLTRQEWDIILTALGAYQHNAQFRSVYERVDAALCNQRAI